MTFLVSGLAGKPASDADDIDRLLRLGWLVVAALGLAMGAFIVAGKVSGAVIAPAVVRADLHRRPVQHLEGGEVSRVLVRDGTHVEAGDLVAELKDVTVDAGLDLVSAQLLAERARVARLDAEQRGASAVVFPADLIKLAVADHAVAYAIERENRLFQSRLQAFRSQLVMFKNQIGEAKLETASWENQIVSLGRAQAIAEQELTMYRDLYEKRFIQKTNVLALERAFEDLISRQEEGKAERSRAEGRTRELERNSATLMDEYRNAAVSELRDATVRVSELEQKFRPSSDAANRLKLYAPVAGKVVGLKASVGGSVLPPRETLMEIVPDEDKLIFDAKVDPADIAQVAYDASAEVRLTTARYRRSAGLMGRVIGISADAYADEKTGQSYFTVQVEVPSSELRQASVPLQAGMSADVYVLTESRTIAWYLIEPIADYLRGSLREE